jgi:Holliday junction DNA helicase RuvA
MSVSSRGIYARITEPLPLPAKFYQKQLFESECPKKLSGNNQAGSSNQFRQPRSHSFMISLLRGIVRHRTPYQLLLDVQGVGYEVLCTQEAYEKSPADGLEYELLTRLIVREDSMTLFAFVSFEERSLFDQIIAVSGIGPKTGISILSSIGSAQLREAIRTSDIHRLIGIPGIGRKTAERMIVELRDKMLKEEVFVASTSGLAGDGSKNRADALQALMALGYPRAAAEKAIRSVLRDTPEAGATVQGLVKASLREALQS